MFRWIKILSQLSKDDAFLEKLEKRHVEIAGKMDQFLQENQKLFDKFNEEYKGCCTLLEKLQKLSKDTADGLAALEKKNADDQATLKEISTGLENCKNQLKDKMTEIREDAGKYMKEIRTEIADCEKNVSEVGEKLKDLGDAIAEFQR